MRRAIPIVSLSLTAALLAACSDGVPSSNAPALLPLVLDPAAQGYDTPDPAYSPPGNGGNIRCTTIVQTASTGPIYEATRWAFGKWEDFVDDNPQVAHPTPADAPEVAGYIVDFCQGTPVATVLDAVNVYLSALPGSAASQFGGVDPPIDVPTPTEPDSILSTVFGGG
ncbi:hypothetical protein [Roseisalinus antarcticus]|uniref:Lipoprotein n=1 Tax=Roseisalinus antarcticus TaxID=254357 RepID=A0A1Y5SH45_9RHOB|nr:hypothetical protein [Roseisalinus antarcticus]SLN40368.1 hypothetical protein ROA7023_01572 [Roseisalinus antarcticus]